MTSRHELVVVPKWIHLMTCGMDGLRYEILTGRHIQLKVSFCLYFFECNHLPFSKCLFGGMF